MILLISFLLLLTTLESPFKISAFGYLYVNEDRDDTGEGAERRTVMPVIDYILPQQGHHSDVDTSFTETKEEYEYRVNHPFFLDSKDTDNGPRVVEFYATWCKFIIQ